MSIKKRIQEDYLKKSRLSSYELILNTAKQSGYKMVGILELYNLVTSGEVTNYNKILINRHDIDTSPKVAKKMFEIEKAVYGQEGSSTYYFRNSTVDRNLIEEIEAYGYETGYHYEEISDYEKKVKTRSVEEIRSRIPIIAELFIEDLEKFRHNSSSKSVTVASHGDFINTKYKFQNYELMRVENIREKAGIVVEAYDNVVVECVKERFADQVLLERFTESVLNSISHECSCIMMLTHPRNWEVDFWDTTRENIKRLIQGILYKL